jgi:hypothetical protein
MNELVAILDRAFSSGSIPSESELVRFDGNDAPAKEYLLKHLFGKTQVDVLNLLRSGAFGDGSMLTEEMELAEPIGLRYYLHPFLVHFASRVRSDSRVLDDETPFFLFAHLKNIFEHRGAGVFTQVQLAALNAFVKEMQGAIETRPPNDGIWLQDVSEKLQGLHDALKSTKRSA